MYFKTAFWAFLFFVSHIHYLSGTNYCMYVCSHWCPYVRFLFFFSTFLSLPSFSQYDLKLMLFFWALFPFICRFCSILYFCHLCPCQKFTCIFMTLRVSCIWSACFIWSIYTSLLFINAPSARLMHSIHLYFKTFPHFPIFVWLPITLQYLGPSSLHSSRRWMVSSKDDSDHSTAFISNTTTPHTPLIHIHDSKCYMWKSFWSSNAVKPHQR